MATNYNAVKKLNQAKAQRQAQLAQAYEDLGGSNPAYKPIQQNNVLASPQRMAATIPQLEKAVVSAYEGNDILGKAQATPAQANRRNEVKQVQAPDLSSLLSVPIGEANEELTRRDALRQQYAPLYNDILDRQFQQKIQRANLEMPEVVETDMGYIRPGLTPELEAAGITKDELNRYLDAQVREDHISDLVNLAQNHPVIATGGAAVARPFEGVVGTAQQVIDGVQGKPLTTSISPSTIMRDTVSGGIDSNLGKVAYGGANSVLDMGVAMLLSKALGISDKKALARAAAGIMATEKANDTMNSAIERNLAPNQVLAEGAGSALSTYLSEVLLGPLENIAGGNSNILLSFGKEGLQEGVEDIIDTLFDQAITLNGGNVEKSELAQNYNAYLNAGYSEEDSKAQVVLDYIGQVGIDVALGGITGGLLQGGSNVMSGRNMVTGNITRNTQNQIINSLNADEVSPDTFNQFSDSIYNLKEAVPEMSKKLDSLKNDVSNQIINDVKEAADTVLESLDPNAYNEFVQNAEQIKVQIPALESDIDNILADFNNEFVTLASESNIKANVDNVSVNVDNVNNNVDTRANVQQTLNVEQPTVQTPEVKAPEIRASRVDLSNARRTTDGLSEKLDYFSSEVDTQPLMNELNEAYDRVVNSRGQAQIDAIQNLNAVANRINEAMRGTTINQSLRDFNEDGYNLMRSVTDGRRIAVTDAQREGAGFKGMRDLNSAVFSGNPNSTIKFYAEGASNTIPLDNVYAEMRDLSNGELPDVTEGDQLPALVNWIRQYKSGKNDTVEMANWDRMNTDSRSSAERSVDDIADTVLDSIDDGDVTAEQMAQVFNMLSEIQSKNPELAGKIAEVQQGLLSAWQLNANLPADIKAIKTPEQAIQAVGEEVQKLDRAIPMNLEMFSESESEAPETDDRELHTGRYKTSKYATNTFPRSEVMTEDEQAQFITDEMKQYEAVTHAETLEKAQKNLKENGYTNEFKDLMSREKWDAVDTDEAQLLLFKSAQDARNAVAAGVDPNEAWAKSVEIFKKIRSEATIGGQMIEALKKWSIKTPEGKLGQALAYAKNSLKEPSADENLLGQLKEAEKDNQINFSDEFITAFLEKAHSLDDANPTKAQEQRLNTELAHMVLTQVPKKFRYKFTALWMNNLLASARTLVTRNVGGNAGKFLLDQTATKLISGPIDSLVSKLTGERTTTGFNVEGLKAGWEGAKKSLADTTRGYWFANAEPDAKFKDLVKDFESLKDNFTLLEDPMLSNRQGVDEDNFTELIKANRSTYNAHNLKEEQGIKKVTGGIENVLKVYDKLIKYGLTISDDPFYSFVYNQTLSELNQIRNNPKKYGGSFSKMSDAKFEKFAKAMATANGLEAVYQNNTKMSDGAMKIKQGVGQMSEGALGIDILSNPLFPFIRTPMNVIRTNLEYHPEGIVKNVIRTIREVRTNLKENRKAFDIKNFDQARFVRETSRNLVGIAMWIVGLGLASKGLLSGGYSDNDKEKQAQKEAGMQEYAFVNPFNGNQSSIDWIPALGSDWVSAAAFYDAFKRNNNGFGEAFGSGLKEGTKSMFELSALQGLQRLTGSGYNSDKNVVDNAIQSLANTASSAVVPAFIRQLAQATDPYKRDTYSGDDKEDLLASLKNNIPFLRETLQPRVGSSGQPMAQNPGRNMAQKLWDNLLNPATTTVPSALHDPVRDEAVRIHEATGLYTGYQPKIERDYLEVGGNEPTAEDLRTFATNANTGMHNAAEEIIGTDYYQSLSDEDKGNMLSNIYKYVREAERAELLGLDPDDLEGAARAYYDDGQDGLLNYLTASSLLARMDSTNNDARREAALNTIDGRDADEINDLIDDYTEKRDSAVEEIYNLMSDTFNGMSAEDTKQLKQAIYTDVRSAELYQALGMDTSNLDGAAAAYLNSGTQGVKDYYYARTALNLMGMPNNPTNRQHVLDVYNSGGDTAVQQMISDSQALSGLNFGSNMTYRYQHATNYIPSLNPQNFYDLFTAIDTVDPEKESITQSELLDYFNSHNVSEQDAMNYWLAFGPSQPWSSIPVLNENGVWVSQR